MATVGKDFPEGFEVVIPCLLDGDKMSDALDLCALGGRIVMYGELAGVKRLLSGLVGAPQAAGLTAPPSSSPLPPLLSPIGCIGPCKNFDFFKMHRKRASIFSTEPRRDIDMRRWFQEGVDMVTDGTVNTSEMITHIYPLERVQEAFQLRNNKDASCEAIHVLIDCERSADGQEKPILKLDGSAGGQSHGSRPGGGSCC
jgi:threonine dehydrogenase-like Zn-dependent dehydrogenase